MTIISLSGNDLHDEQWNYTGLTPRVRQDWGAMCEEAAKMGRVCLCMALDPDRLFPPTNGPNDCAEELSELAKLAREKGTYVIDLCKFTKIFQLAKTSDGWHYTATPDNYAIVAEMYLLVARCLVAAFPPAGRLAQINHMYAERPTPATFPHVAIDVVGYRVVCQTVREQFNTWSMGLQQRVLMTTPEGWKYGTDPVLAGMPAMVTPECIRLPVVRYIKESTIHQCGESFEELVQGIDPNLITHIAQEPGAFKSSNAGVVYTMAKYWNAGNHSYVEAARSVAGDDHSSVPPTGMPGSGEDAPHDEWSGR